jgi:hypothetical protein
VIIPLDLIQLFCPGFELAAGPPSGFTTAIVGCRGELCGEPAFSLHSYTVPLVQWSPRLVPIISKCVVSNYILFKILHIKNKSFQLFVVVFLCIPAGWESYRTSRLTKRSAAGGGVSDKESSLLSIGHLGVIYNSQLHGYALHRLVLRYICYLSSYSKVKKGQRTFKKEHACVDIVLNCCRGENSAPLYA